MNIQLTNFRDDPYLAPYHHVIDNRLSRAKELEERLTSGGTVDLANFASGHEYFGLHKTDNGWVFREWAPNATSIVLVGDFSNWKEADEFKLTRITDSGNWEIKLPADRLKHGDLYRMKVYWDGGEGDRIPAWTRRVVQDPDTLIFNSQVWAPEQGYQWKSQTPDISQRAPLIYEAHIGMAQEREGVGTYCEFRENILPRVVAEGYNTLQLMAIMEHPYYGSFGYHVSSFFASSSRFGTPEELKELIDAAHDAGLAVIMDIVHSHSVSNEVEGIACLDGTEYQYFHEGARGSHEAWGSRCFNYGKGEVLHFLLSNCRYWLDEFHIDGFRFDGVTSMLYLHHGLGPAFDSYERYFDSSVDEDALCYLMLANNLIHKIRPDAITVAEDVSGMPGLGAPVEDGGLGFDFKLAMGIPDYWFKLLKEVKDEDWNMEEMMRELTNRRKDEKSISYVECHDQSIVGGKTLIFELIDAEMYFSMSKNDKNLIVDRGIALHKMIRLATIATAGQGYLTFIGNEFGHPEWVDFPREGNGWSYKYARRQWSLVDNHNLRYHTLGDFEKEFLHLFRSYNLLESKPWAEMPFVNVADQVIAIRRGDVFFLFNFNPTNSFSDYAIDLPVGEYKLLFNSDEERFGGMDRILGGQIFRTEEFDGRACIRTYLPSRTCMVISQ